MKDFWLSDMTGSEIARNFRTVAKARAWSNTCFCYITKFWLFVEFIHNGKAFRIESSHNNQRHYDAVGVELSKLESPEDKERLYSMLPDEVADVVRSKLTARRMDLI